MVDIVRRDNIGGNGQAILRQSIDAAMESLGGPIHKTITWYLSSRGIILSNSKKIDINFFYSNLRDLLGPGADLIMEETWQQLQKRCGAKAGQNPAKCSPLERIQKMIEIGET